MSIVSRYNKYFIEMKGGEINYEAYPKAMRQTLSGCEIFRPDNSLNHKYFIAKKKNLLVKRKQ